MREFFLSPFPTIPRYFFLILFFWQVATPATGLMAGDNTAARPAISGEKVFWEKYLPRLRNKKVWLVTNPSGIGARPVRLRHRFRQNGVNLLGYLALEHGVLGVEEDFQKKARGRTKPLRGKIQGRPVRFPPLDLYNLYRLPAASLRARLAEAEAVILDVGEVGIRVYTYTTILKRLLDGISKNRASDPSRRTRLVVIDHFNPVAAWGAGGPFVKPGFSSFVGEYPMPLYHGMTMGELAHMYKSRHAPLALLTIIRVPGFHRDRPPHAYWGKVHWRPTSPNLPGLESVINYQALVMLEGINVSVGRGTSGPFLYVGAPFLDPEQIIAARNWDKWGARLEPIYFLPTDSVFKGRLCRGVKLYPTPDFRPLPFIFHFVETLFAKFPEIRWLGQGKVTHSDKLWGSTDFRDAINQNRSWNWLRQRFAKRADRWEKKSRAFYLYP